MRANRTWGPYNRLIYNKCPPTHPPNPLASGDIETPGNIFACFMYVLYIPLSYWFYFAWIIALFAWLISHGWKYCWLICCERKILFVGWKGTAYKPSEQGNMCLVVVDEEVLDVEIHVVRECRSTVGHVVFRFSKGQMFCSVNWWKNRLCFSNWITTIEE